MSACTYSEINWLIDWLIKWLIAVSDHNINVLYYQWSSYWCTILVMGILLYPVHLASWEVTAQVTTYTVRRINDITWTATAQVTTLRRINDVTWTATAQVTTLRRINDVTWTATAQVTTLQIKWKVISGPVLQKHC